MGNCLSAPRTVPATQTHVSSSDAPTNPTATITTERTPIPSRTSAPSASKTPTNVTTKTAKTSTIPAPPTVLSQSIPPYTVFISHAGEDKSTIAIPLREKLNAEGVTAFVDEIDMPVSTDAKSAMMAAMESAPIAVVVLSPEFVARKWPMKELMCFLRRREESAAAGLHLPVIIPFFYRLRTRDLYDEPRLDRVDKRGNPLYLESRFLERMKNGEPEAHIGNVKEALQKVHGIMGVRNDVEASNDSGHVMNVGREILLQKLCESVLQAMQAKKLMRAEKAIADKAMADKGIAEGARENVFHAYFDKMQDTSDLVFDFFSRDEDGNAVTQEARLLELVLEESESARRAVAVRGIGGVGKTSILNGITRMDIVKHRFKDGVYVVSLGMDGTKRGLIEELSKAVEGSGGLEKAEGMRREKEIGKVIESFQSWFEKRSCLFAVDDVWETEEIPARIIYELLKLHRCGEHNKVLVTTRSMDIASRAGCYFCLEPRGVLESESRNILVQYSGMEAGDEDHDAVNEILERCSGLPLFLAVAGKAVKSLSFRVGHEGSAAYHAYARIVKKNIEPLLSTDVESYPSLNVKLMISVDLLEERKRRFGFRVCRSIGEMHRRLSVIRKQSKVPMSMLKWLWEVEDESEAAILAREFEQVGLADVEFKKSGSRVIELLRLHDSVYGFAVSEARRLGEEEIGHVTLIQGYGRGLAVEESCHLWWDGRLEADGYIHENLCRHLYGARRVAELLWLLLKPEWMERYVEVNGILFVEEDFLFGIRAAEEGIVEGSVEEVYDVEKGLGLISEAATLSSTFVSRNARELMFQVHGRLKGYGDRFRLIREYVDRIEAEAGSPGVLSVNEFLMRPGGMNTKIMSTGGAVRCIVLMRDGERVACGCEDGRIVIVNVLRSEIEKEWIAHVGSVCSIAVDRDGRRIVSGSWDTTAKLWDVGSRCCVSTFEGHSGDVNSIAAIGNDKRVVSGSDDKTVQIWNMETGHVLSRLSTSDMGRVECGAVVGDGEQVVSGASDHKLRLWNVSSGTQVGSAFEGHDDTVTCLVVTPDGARIVSASYDCTVRMWDVRSHQQIGASLKGHTKCITCVDVSADGSRIVSGADDKTIRVWDSESGKQVCDPLEGHTSFVMGVSFLADRQSIVSCSYDGTVRLWDIRREKSERVGDRHEGRASNVSFTPDGKFVVSGSWDATLRIWDATSGEQVGDQLEGHSDMITAVAVTPNGRWVVSVSSDETLRVWDLQTRKALHTLTGDTGSIWSVAVTPEGDRAVTGSQDKTVRVWDLTAMDGKPVVLKGHDTTVYRVFVTDDGLRVISVDNSDNIFVWELETKTIVKRVTETNAWKLPRRNVFDLVGETTVQDNTGLSIPLYKREIRYGEGSTAQVLATLEADVETWALSPDQNTICVGLEDGQVAFLKLQT